MIVEDFCQLRPFCSTLSWECVINVSVLDYSTYQFVTLIHCISQSEKPEVIPHVLEWCQQEFGEHVFKPQLVILNGDPYTFDSVHTQYSSKVNLYVPFFNYTF